MSQAAEQPQSLTARAAAVRSRRDLQELTSWALARRDAAREATFTPDLHAKPNVQQPAQEPPKVLVQQQVAAAPNADVRDAVAARRAKEMHSGDAQMASLLRSGYELVPLDE